MVVEDPGERLSLEEIARHPWVIKDVGRPVDFEGEVLFSLHTSPSLFNFIF
jgi:hypothetical protein